MKKRFFLLSIFIFSFSINAQIVTIPDANFKFKLINTDCVDTNGDDMGDSDADLNNDGEIQVSEAEAILWLDLSIFTSGGINSLVGIEKFINIKKLNIENNGLQYVDFSPLPALEYLTCRGNLLTGINVENNPNLNFLWCTSNFITDLNLTQNSNLELLRCSSNELTELDVTQNPLLKTLTFVDNQITEIDISNNTLIEILFFSQNQISNLNLTPHSNLRTLLISSNNINSLDVTNNPELFNVDISYNSISEIDLSQNPNLYQFVSIDNTIISLDFSNNLNLGVLSVREPLIDYLDVSLNTNLSRFYYSESEQQNLDLSQNINLSNVILNNNNFTFINLKNSNNNNIARLSILDNPNLACIQVDDEAYASSQECIENDPPYSDEGWCVDDISLFSEDCILGTEDFTNLESFKLYPNPTNNIINIEFKKAAFYNIGIYSVDGKLFLESENQKTLDISNLSAGLYLIKVSSETFSQTKRFIKY